MFVFEPGGQVGEGVFKLFIAKGGGLVSPGVASGLGLRACAVLYVVGFSMPLDLGAAKSRGRLGLDAFEH